MTDHLLHPFAQPMTPEAEFINIVGGQGSTIWDDAGNRYLDGMASLWYCQVGHGRTEIIEAIGEQLNRLTGYNTFAPFTNAPAREVARLVAERSPHPDGRVFLACSGSEAVDTALKLARLVQHRRGHTDKQIIVHRTRGYHGTAYGGTSAQGIAPNRDGFGDLLPHFVEVPGDDLEAVARLFAEHGERIAAVISEPVQGAGGVYPPTDGYLAGLRRLCDRHGALLIFDEVICGFGRTGSWFGAQTFDVVPDLMVFAKGVSSGYQPLSGVILAAAVAESITEEGFLLRHGYTYSGHPVACAAGVANIRLIESEQLVERAGDIGREVAAGLDALRSDGMIERYRGVGAVWAADIGRDATCIRAAMLAHGVIVRAVGETVVICPPLVVTNDEIGRLVETLEAALRE